MRRFLLLCGVLFLTSCQTDRVAEYDAVEIGMAKSEVLDIAGPPHWSDHTEGHDRWIYYMKPETRQQERIVYFQHGMVVKKGLREKPVLTAQEMEEIKKPRQKKIMFKPKYTDEQLKKIIKKEIKQKGREEKENFEPI